MYWMTFPWPWPKVAAVALISKNLLVCAIKSEPLIGSLQNITWQLYCPSHGYYLIRFWRNSVGNFYFSKFSLEISDVFFQGQTLFWPYLRIDWSDWCETKSKCDTGHNMWPWPLTSLMTLTLDVSRSNFEIALSQELLVWLIWNEDGSELKWYWADCMTLPFDHTHDLDLGVEIWRSQSEIALSQEWDGRKGCESSIHDHDID